LCPAAKYELQADLGNFPLRSWVWLLSDGCGSSEELKMHSLIYLVGLVVVVLLILSFFGLR
jgi:hypothetical protein